MSLNKEIHISSKTKKIILFSVLAVVLGFLLVLFAFYIDYRYRVSQVQKNDEIQMTKVMSGLDLPAGFSEPELYYEPIHSINKAGTVDCIVSITPCWNKNAKLTATYATTGLTRDQAFMSIIKALGMNPDDHKSSTDQRLDGNESPIYEGRFGLSIGPDSLSTQEYESSLALCSRSPDYDRCMNDLERQRQADKVTLTMEVWRYCEVFSRTPTCSP